MVHADGSSRPLGTSSSWGEDQEDFEVIEIEDEEIAPAAGGLADSEEFAVDLGKGGELPVSSSLRRGLPISDMPPPEGPPPIEPVGTPESWVSSVPEGEAPGSTRGCTSISHLATFKEQKAFGTGSCSE